MRQIVLDTETTGLHIQEGHRIIEIGCIELINRKFTGQRFHQYLDPERKIDEGAAAVHGLTNALLSGRPLFIDIAQDFMEFIQGAELIIHNAPFDIGFIELELTLTKRSWKPIADHCRIFDTLKFARQLHVGQRNNLDALCKRYHVDNTQREFHGALLDAHLLAQVYLAMTGGQGCLFDDLQTTETLNQDVSAKVKDEDWAARKITIVRASLEELAQHDRYLQQMLEKGKCLWTMTD